MQLSVLRRPLLEDYEQILLLPLTIRGRSRLDHLVDLERLALLVITIKGLRITHLIGLLQSKLISLIHSISISRFMFRSLTLLRLACSHDHYIWEPLLTRHLDHMHRDPRDSSLHWAWLWLELLRSSGTLEWLFLWRRALCHRALCHILFLLISIHMSTTCIIRFRGTILSVVQHSMMRYRIWSIQGWLTWLGQVWPPIPCLHILRMQFLLLLVFSRLVWISRVLMAYGVLGSSGLRTWVNRHGYIAW